MDLWTYTYTYELWTLTYLIYIYIYIIQVQMYRCIIFDKVYGEKSVVLNTVVCGTDTRGKLSRTCYPRHYTTYNYYTIYRSCIYQSMVIYTYNKSPYTIYSFIIIYIICINLLFFYRKLNEFYKIFRIAILPYICVVSNLNIIVWFIATLVYI